MTISYDSLAVSILLSKSSPKAKQAQLKKLAARASGQRECPECGTVAVHEDNGCTGEELSWCCIECGCHFDEVAFFP
jgi:hypothetical protein